MADPQHIAELDDLDRFTVRAYRLGLLLAAGGLSWTAAAQLTGEAEAVGWGLIVGGTGLAVVNLHLYAKTIRWVVQASAALGLVILAIGGPPLVVHAGHGFLFVALSALAFKEWFCFRIPGLRLMPLLLAGALIPLVAGRPEPAAALLGGAGILYAILAVGKLRQPLHYDIGDKSRYQI